MPVSCSVSTSMAWLTARPPTQPLSVMITCSFVRRCSPVPASARSIQSTSRSPLGTTGGRTSEFSITGASHGCRR